MKCLFAFFLALLTAIAPVIAQSTQPTTQPDEEKLTPAELSAECASAIQGGVKYLLKQQNDDGSWASGRQTDSAGGNTALVTLALLYSGESPQSPALDKAIKFLKKAQPQKSVYGTYSVGLRACVYASLPEPMRKDELRADLRWLEETMIQRGDRAGMYDYGSGFGLGGDYSNSQYGVLGVWYAAEAGLEVPNSYWKRAEDAWRAGQNQDGGWPYMPDRGNSYASMTAAGAATLYITNDYLHAKESGDLTKIQKNEPLENAVKWLGDHFAVNFNAGVDKDPNPGGGMNRDMQNLIGDLGSSPGFQVQYMLFGYERVGEASGLTRFGTQKWFDQGAEFLINTQTPRGSWVGTNGPEIDTAYSLLFLSRGRAPIVMQKLQFDGRWNNRPRDVYAFTHFMRRASERHVNWQIVSADADPEELRESTLLYVASDRPLTLKPDEQIKIKNFIQQGGLLVCVNEGGTQEFVSSLTSLASSWFPDYKFRDLPPDHPIYTLNFPPPTPPEPIRGLSNGVRELIVLYPSSDVSWKLQSAGGGYYPKNSPYATFANLLLYANDMANPRYKGQDIWIDRNPEQMPTKTAHIARIKYDGNWDPEPAGWQRFANWLWNKDQIDLRVEPTATPSKNQPLAHLTATQSLQMQPFARDMIRDYLKGGGLLLMDAAGGSPEAAGSFEPLLREMFPKVEIAPLPLDHPVYHGRPYGGVELDHVQYRRSADLQQQNTPRLRAAMVDGKLVALLSYEDLSAGLVGNSVTGLQGYSPASAMDLVRNIILWRTSTSK